MKPRKHVGIVRGGLGFVLKKGPRRVSVHDMGTLRLIKTLKVPASIISRYDLSIWVDGYLAGGNG